MRRRLSSRYNLDPLRFAVIPNRPSVRNEDIARGYAAPLGPFTFLCLTRYYGHKNLEIVVEAMRLLGRYTSRKAKCVFTVSADQHPGARRLIRSIEQYGLSELISVVGRVQKDRLGEIYRSSDALLMPTLLESYTRTYAEAMSFGVPILTSDRDFARFLCEDAALYFDPLDANAVARAMATVIEDADLRGRLAANGRRLLERAPTWEQIAAQFVAVLEAAAKGQPISAVAAEFAAATASVGARSEA
jgi:glycosyltransferase involved in cell wall biosynthesis